MCRYGNDVNVGGDKVLFDTLKRAITRGNYASKKEMANKLSLLYSAEKITVEQYVKLTFLLEEVN